MKKSRRYDTSQPLLDVYLHGRLIGHIGHHSSDLWFQYRPEIHEAADAERFLISVRLPVQPEPFTHEETIGFFDNLLLEEGLRDALARATRHDRRDTAGLLGLVGGECAGAVSVWPHGMAPPEPPRYRTCEPGQLEELFATAHGTLLTRAQLESRQSMSGAQDKLVFRRLGQRYELPLGGAPGNVLLKRPSPRYDGLVQNELAGQWLARALGIPAAETRAAGGATPLLESVRFDRYVGEDSGIRRLHQEDFCQALGRPPIRKYQAQNGPGFADISRILRAHSANPAEDLDLLIKAAILNICLGNEDAHAKNFALLYTDHGLRLAPLYDVLSTEVYDELTRGYAMYVGTAHRASQLDGVALARFARDVEVGLAVVHGVIEEMTARLPAEWERVRVAVAEAAGEDAVLERMAHTIEANTARLQGAASKR
jgi:serine/threonine-protein kinase HipA